jgi:molecular chaperone DnaK
MTIASSSGLSDKEIERMVVDAEQYAEQDKSRRDIIEESNKAESVCADTEKGENTVSTNQFECSLSSSHE